MGRSLKFLQGVSTSPIGPAATAFRVEALANTWTLGFHMKKFWLDHLLLLIFSKLAAIGVWIEKYRTMTTSQSYFEETSLSSLVLPFTHPRYFSGDRRTQRLFDFLKRRPLQCCDYRQSAVARFFAALLETYYHHHRTVASGQKADWLPSPENYRWFRRFKERDGRVRRVAALHFRMPKNVSSQPLRLREIYGCG